MSDSSFPPREGAANAPTGTDRSLCFNCGHLQHAGGPCSVRSNWTVGFAVCLCGRPLLVGETQAAGPLPAVHAETVCGCDRCARRRELLAKAVEPATPTPDPRIDALAATPEWPDPLETLRAHLRSEIAVSRDAQSRAAYFERQWRATAAALRERDTRPYEALGWGWRSPPERTGYGPLPTREAAIAQAIATLGALSAIGTTIPTGTKLKHEILVGECWPWYPEGLYAVGQLGAMDREAKADDHLLAQVAPMEWSDDERGLLDELLKGAFTRWVLQVGMRRPWTFASRGWPRAVERVQVEIVVGPRDEPPAKALASIDPHGTASADGSQP